ncbi:hypothetical protein XA68_12717 [Ophiocordyceps unilateralis]|uniref:Uncharacterized protein n=1 Tax=Ophiocordyceps unilateralis TaxID=268505 RepID=A0A2A9PP20_OPHUN|nr:hypothetical protein XA68_12717 [Ophiocordyceps unilateralis]
MSSAPSPQQLGWRGFAIVPRDQQKLLDSHDSWAADFGLGPHAFANVPGHVLETTQQAYRAKHTAIVGPDLYLHPTSSAASKAVPREASPDGNLPHSPEAHTPGPEQAAVAGPEPDRSAPSPSASSPERIISSWSESPKRSRTPFQGSSVVHETPKAVKSTPRPRQYQLTADDAMDGSEVDDLEVFVPQAEADVESLINRVAARPPAEADNGEPCTQPNHVVDAAANSATSKYGSGRCRGANKVTETLPPSKAMASAETNLLSQHAVAQRQQAVQIYQATKTATKTPPPPTSTHPPSLLKGQRRASTWEPERAERSLNPCEAFLAAYPDYVTAHGGSLQNFVNACLCLSWYRQEWLLRDSSFDEFVRFFSAEYLRYVARAGPGQEPLPAIERFNMQRGAPLYTQMVLTGQELNDVFDAYPEEYRTARSVIMDDSASDGKLARNLQSSPPASRPSPELGSERVPSSTLPAPSSSVPQTLGEYKSQAEARLGSAKGKRCAFDLKSLQETDRMKRFRIFFETRPATPGNSVKSDVQGQ